ncbi:MAG: hypothetical protein B7Z66_07320 [Chromatiales bacterium 21-64-14]|nr:MAG: hypothetical protein B7Z66_07320 [Chromatiales bacterium 21-64-14]
MGIGGILRAPDGTPVASFSDAAGHGTNNEAEWLAFYRGIEVAGKSGAQQLLCLADSELVIRQFSGDYAVRNPRIYALYRRAHALARAIPRGVSA